MNKITLFLLLATLTGPTMGQQVLSLNPDKLKDTHDIALSPWGPYSKKYAGISHIPDQQKGLRYDISVMPGYYRNKVLVPNVRFESGYFPWKISNDMSHITYRYELEWKDRVFVDVTYIVRDSSTVLVQMNCVNNTQLPQNLVLNLMGYLDYPEDYPNVSVDLPENCQWGNGISYQDMAYAVPRPSDHLVYNGWLRGEERNGDYIGGSALAKGFGKDKNDKVVYSVPVSGEQRSGIFYFRYRAKKNAVATFKASGLVNDTLKFKGTGNFELLEVPYRTGSKGIDHHQQYLSGGFRCTHL